jgi:hypothetical protein
MNAAPAGPAIFLKTHLRDFGHLPVRASKGQKPRKNRGLPLNTNTNAILSEKTPPEQPSHLRR